jgi:hypothetical protein
MLASVSEDLVGPVLIRSDVPFTHMKGVDLALCAFQHGEQAHESNGPERAFRHGRPTASFWAESTLVRPDRSDAGDLCGQELDAVSVEVAAGAGVVLGGSGVGVAGEDLGVAEGDASIEGVGDAACRRECGLMCRGMSAALAIRATMR